MLFLVRCHGQRFVHYVKELEDLVLWVMLQRSFNDAQLFLDSLRLSHKVNRVLSIDILYPVLHVLWVFTNSAHQCLGLLDLVFVDVTLIVNLEVSTQVIFYLFLFSLP